MPFTNESALQIFEQNIQRFPLLHKYLGESLSQCLQLGDWLDNRVIQYILADERHAWIRDRWEHEFKEAALDNIPNAEEIFSVLKGNEIDFGEKLFDAMAEVRLARWAWLNGYKDIEKLAAGQGRQTPEFRMTRNGTVTLAEAKHFRTRDYLPSFVFERLMGLKLKTGTSTGIRVGTTPVYRHKRDHIISNRDNWVTQVRRECTEDWFLTLVSDTSGPLRILDGLLTVETARTDHLHWGSSLDTKDTVNLMLEKLEGDLEAKLRQIKGFIDSKQSEVSHAVVFFSGIDGWETEWDLLWKAMASQPDAAQWPWDRLNSIQERADGTIRIPFELIIGRGNPVQYGPLPWRPAT